MMSRKIVMSRSRAVFWGGAIAVIVSVGCGERPPDSFSVDTLANGTVQVQNFDRGRWGEGGGEGWRLVEWFRVGSVDDEGNHDAFGRIGALALDQNGRLYVLDGQAKQVIVFDTTGKFIRTIGRSGKGPGEFGAPVAITFDRQGRLWVIDQGNSRYTVVDDQGDLVKSIPREFAGFTHGWGGGFNEVGDFFDVSLNFDFKSGTTRTLLVRSTVDLERGQVIPGDTITLPRFAAKSWKVQTGQMQVALGVPHTPTLEWRLDGRNGVWLTMTGEYRLYHRNFAGDTTRIVEKEFVPIPVTNEDIDQFRESFSQGSMKDVLKSIDLGDIPDVRPAISRFALDDAGYLWVVPVTEGATGLKFDIFDPDGRFLGSVTVPLAAYPLPVISGNHLAGRVYDRETGVSQAVVYRIEGRRVGV